MTAAVMGRRLLALVGLMLAATSASGGSALPQPLSKVGYERAMRAVDSRYGPLVAKAEKAAALSQSATAAVYTRRLGLAYKQEANALASIAPPTEVAPDHRVFVSFYRVLWRHTVALAAFIDSRSKGTLAAGQTAPRFSEGIWLVRTLRAASDMRQKGYRIGSFTTG